MTAFVAEAGTTVAGRYRLERPLGQGGMGVVWAATHLVTRKPVALKFLKAAAWAKPEVRRRLVREARATSAIRHPNVLQVHDILELGDGAPVLVMDLLEGESLGARLVREGALPLPTVARILGPVVSGVGMAHALGIVHRDLKPDNIFIVRLPDGGEDVRVLDFGIAKLTAPTGDAAQSGELTRTGDMLGTPFYMAPEQAFGEDDLDARADIWAIGVVLYECLSGARPFPGENFGQVFKRIALGAARPLAEIVPGLPRELTDLVHGMLSQDRGQRPSDLHRVRELLQRYTDAPMPAFGRPRRLGRRAPRLALVGAAALSLIAGLAGWLLNGRHADPGPPIPLSPTQPDRAIKAAEPPIPPVAEPPDPIPHQPATTPASPPPSTASSEPQKKAKPKKKKGKEGEAPAATEAGVAPQPAPGSARPPTSTPGGVIAKPPF